MIVQFSRLPPSLRIAAAMLVMTITSGAASSAANRQPSSCIVGMRDALIRGHFTGPLVCSKRDASFMLVGRTTGGRFSIYDYRYRYLPSGGNVMHGGQKIIVFRRETYVGQYALSPPPFVKLAVKGTQVELRARGDRNPVQLDMSRDPPSKILVNGEVETFFH